MLGKRHKRVLVYWRGFCGTSLRGNPAALDEIKKTPAWLAALLIQAYDSLAAGLQTDYGSEAQLQNVYLKTKGRVVGLDTFGEQMRGRSRGSHLPSNGRCWRRIFSRRHQKMADVMDLHRLWRIGDAEAIAGRATAKSDKLARSEPVSDAIDNKIVCQRNRRFVALHLGGEGSSGTAATAWVCDGGGVGGGNRQ